LDKAITTKRQGVRLIGMGVSNLAEPSRQTTLFSAPNRKLEELNKTINRIRDRYGFGAIQTGRVAMLKDIEIR
jgi:DNA polymerase-4